MRTIELDEDYDNSGIDHTEYTEGFSGPAESDFVLDKVIQEEKDRRVELYSKRFDEGLDVFSGQPLSLSDLLCMRGLGNFAPSIGITKLSKKERELYEVQGLRAG